MAFIFPRMHKRAHKRCPVFNFASVRFHRPKNRHKFFQRPVHVSDQPPENRHKFFQRPSPCFRQRTRGRADAFQGNLRNLGILRLPCLSHKIYYVKLHPGLQNLSRSALAPRPLQSQMTTPVPDELATRWQRACDSNGIRVSVHAGDDNVRVCDGRKARVRARRGLRRARVPVLQPVAPCVTGGVFPFCGPSPLPFSVVAACRLLWCTRMSATGHANH